MYTERNFKTKKALKQAIADGERVTIYQPGGMFAGSDPTTGTHAVEGPHYPQPHRWYAEVTVKDGYVVKVK